MKKLFLSFALTLAFIAFTACDDKSKDKSRDDSDDEEQVSDEESDDGNGKIVDKRDGHKYRTVRIGDQVWMAENLNFKVNDRKQSWCYDNKKSNCKKYGRLYTWAAAVGKSESQCGYGKECNLRGQVQGVCPAGWHLPSKEEWETLWSAVGGKDVAGKKLKSTSGWVEDGNGTDAYGFSALPAGLRYSDGDFSDEGGYAYFWSSSESNSDDAYLMHLSYGSENAYLDDIKGPAFSVRCLQNSSVDKKNSSRDISDLDETEPGERRGKADGAFDEGPAAGVSGGVGDEAGLLGGNAGGIGTKAKGTVKTPSARDTDMDAGGGSRSAADIMKVVKQRTPGLRHTYDQYLKKKPGFQGKVTLRFTIAPSGDVISISIASSTTGYGEFDGKIKDAVRNWKFSRVKSDNTTVTIPFTFSE